MAKKIPMRDGYGKALLEMIPENPDIMVLDGGTFVKTGQNSFQRHP